MHRTFVSLTVLSIIAVLAVPAMAATDTSGTARQANTITEKVVSTSAPAVPTAEPISQPVIAAQPEPTPVATPAPKQAKTSTSSSSSSKSRKKGKNEPEYVPAQSFAIPDSSTSQANSERQSIANALASSVEGMAVGADTEEIADDEADEKEKKDKGPNVMELPPFAERYPPESITSVARAEEVIDAYKHEVAAINRWEGEAEKPCYRKFLVNHCLSKTMERARDKKNEAKRVWVVARDFIRKEKSDQAYAERIQKDKERAELVARIDAQALRKKGTGLVSDAPDADIDTRGFMTVNDGKRTDKPKIDRDSNEKLNIVEPRELTLEQEETNELEYERREMAREEKVQKAEAEEPTPPSTTEAERAASREERRKAAEEKRKANIRKREQKAAEYDKQVQLRAQQAEQEKKN